MNIVLAQKKAFDPTDLKMHLSLQTKNAFDLTELRHSHMFVIAQIQAKDCKQPLTSQHGLPISWETHTHTHTHPHTHTQANYSVIHTQWESVFVVVTRMSLYKVLNLSKSMMDIA